MPCWSREIKYIITGRFWFKNEEILSTLWKSVIIIFSSNLKEQESKELSVLHFLHEFCSGLQALSYIDLLILSHKMYRKLVAEIHLYPNRKLPLKWKKQICDSNAGSHWGIFGAKGGQFIWMERSSVMFLERVDSHWDERLSYFLIALWKYNACSFKGKTHLNRYKYRN